MLNFLKRILAQTLGRVDGTPPLKHPPLESDDVADPALSNAAPSDASIVRQEDVIDPALPAIPPTPQIPSEQETSGESLTPQFRHWLKTDHETILAYDGNKELLTHCLASEIGGDGQVVPVFTESARIPAVLRTDSHGWITEVTVEGRPRFSLLEVEIDHARLIISEAGGDVPSLTFQMGDKYLCAEPNGDVSVNRTAAGGWETFRLIAEPT